MSVVYHIQVNDVENDETYNLFFNGLQTVREVKDCKFFSQALRGGERFLLIFFVEG